MWSEWSTLSFHWLKIRNTQEPNKCYTSRTGRWSNGCAIGQVERRGDVVIAEQTSRSWRRCRGCAMKQVDRGGDMRGQTSRPNRWCGFAIYKRLRSRIDYGHVSHQREGYFLDFLPPKTSIAEFRPELILRQVRRIQPIKHGRSSTSRVRVLFVNKINFTESQLCPLALPQLHKCLVQVKLNNPIPIIFAN
jgi:hypothetical protein